MGSSSSKDDEKNADGLALIPPDKDARLSYEKSSMNDIVFAVLFLLHFIGLCIAAGEYGQDISWDTSEGFEGFGWILLMMFMGFLGGLFFLKSLNNCAGTIIRVVLIGQPVLCTILAAVLFAAGAIILGIFFLVAAILLFLYYWAVKSRIPFAVALIKIATDIVNKFPATICAALSSIIGQVVFMVIWGIAFIGYIDGRDDDDKDAQPGAIFLFMLSMYWGLEVLRYVLFVTISGVTASWFFFPGQPDPTASAAKRATTTSFGSICFGALVISILRALEALLRSAMNSENDNVLCTILSCLALCILNCIESLLEYLNQFGFVYVAVYGYGYVRSCKQVFNLMRATGFEALIQYDLTSSAMFASALITGLFVCGITAVMTKNYGGEEVSDNWQSLALLGLFIGLFFAFIMMQVLIAAINTIFVIWAEDPRAVFLNRPAEAKRLVEATHGLDADEVPPLDSRFTDVDDVQENDGETPQINTQDPANAI